MINRLQTFKFSLRRYSMGMSARKVTTKTSRESYCGAIGLVETATDEGVGVEVAHTQKQLDFLRDALEDHFLFKALPLQTLEHVARLFRYVRTPAGKVGRCRLTLSNPR
jgi:hypothetical protein